MFADELRSLNREHVRERESRARSTLWGAIRDAVSHSIEEGGLAALVEDHIIEKHAKISVNPDETIKGAISNLPMDLSGLVVRFVSGRNVKAYEFSWYGDVDRRIESNHRYSAYMEKLQNTLRQKALAGARACSVNFPRGREEMTRKTLTDWGLTVRQETPSSIRDDLIPNYYISWDE